LLSELSIIGTGVARHRARRHVRHGARGGFSLLELLVVMAIIMIVMGLLLASVRRARAGAQSVHCLSNLRQISTGLRMFASDNANRFPDPKAEALSWETMICKYVPNNKVFLCLADEELGPVAGSSYDWRDTAVDDTTLAGRLITDVRRADTVLAYEALPGWHVKRMMNVARIDGSCCTLDDQAAVGDLLKPIR
jgi:Tfp pilus assembly protein PilV